MEKVYKNNPNFLGSEVGLVQKTITIPADFATYVTENGRKIVKAGTIFTTPYYGLLFEDRDITDGAVSASLMIGGRYIDANLPATASAYVASFASQGLYPIVEGSVSRPDFGTVGLSALSTPVITVTSASIAWASISNAVDYTVYNSNKVELSVTSGLSYTATATGTYYVQANADNINYKSSALASASVSQLS